MFKIKCGNKYLKKVFLGDDLVDKMIDDYIAENGEFNRSAFKKKHLLYEPCGIMTQVSLVDDIADASSFTNGELALLRRSNWFYRLRNRTVIKQ